MKLIALDHSMAAFVRSRIKLERSAGNGPQINTIPIETAGRVAQTLVIQPVQQSFVVCIHIYPILHYHKYLIFMLSERQQ